MAVLVRGIHIALLSSSVNAAFEGGDHVNEREVVPDRVEVECSQWMGDCELGIFDSKS